jgi:hypothetical protein
MAAEGIVEVVTDDLRALLFWANVGVRQSKGGAYEDDIANIIESYAKHIRMQLPRTKFKRNGTERDGR